MEKQTVIGFVLIAIVFMVWMYMSMPDPAEQKKAQESAARHDSTATVKGDTSPAKPQKKTSFSSEKDSADTGEFGKWFSHLTSKPEKLYTIETDKYTAVFTTAGGGIKRWTLKEYSTWNNAPLQLVDWRIGSDLNLFFGTSDGKLIDTKNVSFLFPDFPESGIVTLTDSSSVSFTAVLPVVGDSAVIIKKYTLQNGKYDFALDVELRNMGGIIANNEYQLTIHSLAYTEKNSVDEASFAEANVLVEGSRESIDAAEDTLVKETFDGKTTWVATHTKYFINALIPTSDSKTDGAYFEGIGINLPNGGKRELYLASVKMDYRGKPIEKDHFQVLYAPMEYDLLKSQGHGLEQVMSLGWDFIIRPFSEYLVIPLFTFLHNYIPNYGIVIIIFSIIIKLLLYPLTKSSMNSMKKMKALQPMMNEMKEKHKDDPQKQSAEMMKLYRDYGVNPAGGCGPMLLQMPILFALFTIFRSTIELRHEPFVLWITDLSTADAIVHLPFTIPLIGLSNFSGLALLMAITMFIQQKQTIQDPRQKAMVYMMPVMMWLLFNSFPAGLNLYYFMFNLLSIIQQWMVNKKEGDVVLVKVDKSKKKSWTERMLASAQERAKEQQKASKRR